MNTSHWLIECPQRTLGGTHYVRAVLGSWDLTTDANLALKLADEPQAWTVVEVIRKRHGDFPEMIPRGHMWLDRTEGESK